MQRRSPAAAPGAIAGLQAFFERSDAAGAMFGVANETEFDVRFTLFGIPVRVHPVFWLSSGFLAWEGPRVDLTLVGILCVFLSILVHELGHAIVTRRFGWQPEIVLYFFGGYATTRRHSTWKDIAVLIAGPASGFALYGATLGLREYLIRSGVLAEMSQSNLERISYAIGMLLFANLVWNLMNLVPVIPLDGGQICRELCLWMWPRHGMKRALMVSIAASGAVALFGAWCVRNEVAPMGAHPTMLTIFFAFMCANSVQMYQAHQRGYW